MKGTSAASSSDLRRVAFAAGIGSLAEYFDWGVAAPISALVWPSVFFPQLSPAEALAASLATFGSVYLVRPIGAYLFGRFGDEKGRRTSLTWTLVAMGLGSLGLGLSPSYSMVGSIAPAFLIGMRLVQGMGHGGEWGGASTWIAELASNTKRRAFWTSWVTFAAPAGNLLASMSFFWLSLTMHRADFFSYGWRILFASGAIVAVIGLLIRWRFVESPVFEAERSRPATEIPQPGFLRTEWRRLLTLTLSFGFLSLVVGILTSTYGLGYLAALGVTTTQATFYAWIARIPGLIAFIVSAFLADLKGRLFPLRIGTLLLIPAVLLFFPLVNLKTFYDTLLAFVIIEIPVDFASGGIAALFTESFRTRHRSKGAGLSYHSGSLISGVVLTIIVPTLVSSLGSVTAASGTVSVMLACFLVISLLTSLKVPETLVKGRPPGLVPSVS